MKKNIILLEIRQPIGTFYFGKMCAQDLISIKEIKRVQEGTGVQRLLKPERVKAVSLFCEDPDATFPTPIIMAIDSENMPMVCGIQDGLKQFSFDDSKKIAEVLDGQHRIEGIEKSGLTNIELPVVIMFDLSEEQKAYVFSTINGTQERVNPSVIYELFKLNPNRSPQKTCHEIARALNSDPQSPFYHRLKMMERREFESETISQNTFVKSLCGLISKNPQRDAISLKKGDPLKVNDNLAFSYYFNNDQDAVIHKILLNYFSAVASVFSNEWDNPKYFILSKTVGFSALMDALNTIVPIGEKRGTLSFPFFREILVAFKKMIEAKGVALTSNDFSSSGADKNKLSSLIVQAATSLEEQ